jgi:hypothetical protein
VHPRLQRDGFGSPSLPTTTRTLGTRLGCHEAVDALDAVTRRETGFGKPGQSEAKPESVMTRLVSLFASCQVRRGDEVSGIKVGGHRGQLDISRQAFASPIQLPHFPSRLPPSPSAPPSNSPSNTTNSPHNGRLEAPQGRLPRLDRNHLDRHGPLFVPPPLHCYLPTWQS